MSHKKKTLSLRAHRIRSIGFDAAYGLLSAGAGAAPVLLSADYVTAGCASCLALAGATLFAKQFHLVKAEPQPIDIASLDCALEVIHAMAMHAKKVAVEPKLRICVYVRKPNDKSTLQRITSMVGDFEVDHEPKEIPVQCGIVGHVARTGKPNLAHLEKNGNLTEYLKEWGFEPEMAAQIREDRRSWYGIPLGATGQSTVGVLLCDSSDPTFFGNETCARQKILRQGAIPIAAILKRAYTGFN